MAHNTIIENRLTIRCFLFNRFRYLSSGEEVVYTDWRNNNPNDQNQNEDYVLVYVAEMQMDDIRPNYPKTWALCIKSL